MTGILSGYTCTSWSGKERGRVCLDVTQSANMEDGLEPQSANTLKLRLTGSYSFTIELRTKQARLTILVG